MCSWPAARAVYSSRGSQPAMTSRTTAASVTVRAIGPGVSWKCTSGEKPVRLTSPVVGRNPNRLVNEAGSRIDPPVSSPMPTRARSAATAAAGARAGPAAVPAQVVGVAGEPGAGGEGEPAGGEVAHRRLAEHDRSGLPQPGDDGGVALGDVVGEQRTAEGGGDPGGLGLVLDDDGHPVQRAQQGSGAGEVAVGPLGLGERGGVDGDHGVEGWGRCGPGPRCVAGTRRSARRWWPGRCAAGRGSGRW